MMVNPPPLLGYNNNVRHRGKVFHIQTEDSGIAYPRVVTHLFADGGRIVKTTRTDYAEHVGREDMVEIVRRLMKEQHKAMFVALRGGELDPQLEAACGPLDPVAVRPAEAPAPPPPAEPEPAAAQAPPTPVEERRSNAPPALASQPPPSAGRRRMLSNPNLRRSVPPPPSDGRLPSVPTQRLGSGAAEPGAVPRPSAADQSGRYAASRPSTIFADAPKPTSSSIFGDAVISEKSLDEVILSYLAEDVDEPPE